MSELVGIWVKMDVGIRDGVLKRLRPYGGAVYAVWICLGSHVGESGGCYPSLRTIARETGYSLSTVQRAIEGLEKEGLIIKFQNKKKGADSYYANVYNLKGWFSYGKVVP